MSGAEELRQAAATIRERADKAGVQESWVTLEDFPHEVWIAKPTDRESMDEDMVAGCTYPSQATHIATWSAPVALAVALWLEATARDVEVLTVDGRYALKVASLINGGAA